MLYLGHFTWDGERPDDSPLAGPTTGWFTPLVEADSPKEAIGKFGKLIESADDNLEVFDNAHNIYFEPAIVVKELPPEGVFAHWHEYPDAQIQGAMSTTLPPDGGPQGVDAFERHGPGVEVDEEDEEEGA